jgi:spermidine synthase
MKKNLLINGIGITGLSPAIKMMAHLPLSFLGHKPRNVLVICFGMGTTYRSMLSWGVPVTGVELVPSVPQLFGYYHADGPALLRSPRSHVVIDDGRRFLERTPQTYDVIAIDPPPPVSAAGSSLLYSEEFYAIVRQHLRRAEFCTSGCRVATKWCALQPHARCAIPSPTYACTPLWELGESISLPA